MSAGEWAAWVGAGAAVIAAAVAWWQASGSTKQADVARRQAEAAERDARAAGTSARAAQDALLELRRSADAGERSADAHESIARDGVTLNPAYAPRWVLEPVRGMLCSLRNETGEQATDVAVELPGIVKGERTFASIGPGSAVTVMVVLTGQTGRHDARVTWHRPNGEPADWTGPVPR